MSANTTNEPRQPLPDVFSDAELVALKARLRSDPAAARAFALVQQRGYELLRTMARDAMIKLAAMEPPLETADAGADWRRFSGLARDRENAAKERRLLAQDLVIGALVNLDNPAWDPLDPSTSRESSSSSLLALLDPDLADPKLEGGR